MADNPYLPRTCTILAVHPENDHESTLRIATTMVPVPGQFVEVSLPQRGEAPISICGMGEGWIELTIRGAGQFTKTIRTLQAGDVLHVRGPYGRGFPVASWSGRHLIVAAGGSGVASVRGLIGWCLDHPGHVTRQDVIVGYKSPSMILYRDEMVRWQENGSVIVTVDVADESWSGRTGLLTQHAGEIVLGDAASTVVAIVGPPAMMKATAQAFAGRGVAPADIWVSFERLMACGLGKCGHCKIDNTYVCVDGPVIPYDKAVKLID